MSEKIKKTITLTTPAKPRLPKRIGSRVDAFYEMRESRLAYGRQIKEAEAVLKVLKEREDEVAKALHKEMRAIGGQKLTGEVATFSVGRDDVFTVEDWEEFYAYIAENDAFELLEKRPGRGALKDRLGTEDFPPGVKADAITTYHLTKASKK